MSGTKQDVIPKRWIIKAENGSFLLYICSGCQLQREISSDMFHVLFHSGRDCIQTTVSLQHILNNVLFLLQSLTETLNTR